MAGWDQLESTVNGGGSASELVHALRQRAETARLYLVAALGRKPPRPSASAARHPKPGASPGAAAGPRGSGVFSHAFPKPVLTEPKTLCPPVGHRSRLVNRTGVRYASGVIPLASAVLAIVAPTWLKAP
jgi:hypothetical protein